MLGRFEASRRVSRRLLARHRGERARQRVIQFFEPWMALSFTEGSIGGDIERVSIPELQALYDTEAKTTSALVPLPSTTVSVFRVCSSTSSPRLLSDAVSSCASS